MASPEKLVELLKGSQLPDTSNLRAVTLELQNNYYTKQECLLWLFQVATTNDDASLRQLAAVQASRLVDRHWTATPPEQKAEVRQHLVNSTLKDGDSRVRHALARCVAAVAAEDAADNNAWPDLVPGVLHLAGTSTDPTHREVASYVLYSLLEDNPEYLRERVTDLLQLFAKTLRDPESAAVRINSMMSCASLVLLLDEEEEGEQDEAARSALRDLVPLMVDVLKSSIAAGDEEKTRQAFEVLQGFLAVDSALLSTAYLRELITFMMELSAKQDGRDDEVRSQALSFLAQCVRFRRMKIQGMRDVAADMTVRALQVLTELDATDEEIDEATPAAYALDLIGELTTNLPPRQACVAVLDKLPALAKHEDPAFRQAAVLALGKAAEGSPEFVGTQLKTTVMPVVLALLHDADVMVRLYSLDALVQLADSMHSELSPYHAALLEGVTKNLEFAIGTDPGKESVPDKVIMRLLSASCRSIDAMSAGFEEATIDSFAPRLVEQTGTLLTHSEFRVKAGAAGALGAIASAMGEKFRPFFAAAMEALSPFVAAKDSEEDMTLRAQVCDSLGRIATAVGGEAFQPYVRDLMAASEEGLKLDNPRLRETSFLLWGTLAEVYGTDFAVFLDGVLKALFEALEPDSDDEEDEQSLVAKVEAELAKGAVFVEKVKKSKPKADGAMDAEEEDDDDDDDESAMELIDWAEAQEQAVAVESLGDVLVHACGKDELARVLEKAIELVAPMASNPYEVCRRAAISTLWRAYGKVWQLWEEETGLTWTSGFPPMMKVKPGEGEEASAAKLARLRLTGVKPEKIEKLPFESNPVLSKLGEIAVQATLSIWGDDPDRDVVMHINENIRQTLETCGPAIFLQDEMLQQTLAIVSTIITRTHPCLQDLGDDDEEEPVEGGSSEEDWMIVDTGLDVVTAVAGAMGEDFGELWKMFEKPVLKYASSDEGNERSTAVGAIAQCINYMGAAVTPYTGRLLKLLVHRLSDEDGDVKSNAAYATGLLFEKSTDERTYLAQYNVVLGKLESLLATSESRVLDNAAGCVARMIAKHPDRVPIGQVLPALVDILPLKEDYEENAPVYECIVKLYELNEPTVLQLTPTLLPIFTKVMGPPDEQLEPETRVKLENCIKTKMGN